MFSVRVRHRGPSVRLGLVDCGKADSHTRDAGMARPRQAKTALSLRLVSRGADYSAVSHGATRGRSSLLLSPDASGVLRISLPEAVSGPALAAFVLLDVLPIPADRVEVTTLLQGRSYSASENGVNLFCDRIRVHALILCPLSARARCICSVLAVLPIRPIFELWQA